MTEFLAYPKTPRLFRDMVITEKIDGTNAAIQISRRDDQVDGLWFTLADSATVVDDDVAYAVTAQSRKRIITPDDDNFGFAFMNPEGIVVYHGASNQVFKVLLENDEVPKGAAA